MTEPVLNVLSALAEPTRLRIVRLLAAGGELCACELMPRLGVSQSRISRHMAMLKNAGLVVDRRDRQWVRFRLNPDMPPEIRAVLDAVLAAARTTQKTEEPA